MSLISRLHLRKQVLIGPMRSDVIGGPFKAFIHRSCGLALLTYDWRPVQSCGYNLRYNWTFAST